ncbi:MAG: APC family permease [Chroococcidiopsidaceae cyanobacterium CP_BM_ER_R8_30]|nr:APC family permease [Chroococcidiopsidaceae cyanobacterium CP_BM_ER_R8_30]
MVTQKASRLRANCLNFAEVLAQGIALISPTMTAALIVPLTFSSAGEATWLAYLFGTVMLLFVAFNLNQFASRSASAGSMYIYTGRGLGPLGSTLSGWCLVWAYLFIGMAGLTGFSIFANQLLGLVGIHVPDILLFAICAGVAWLIAYRDVTLSSILMLALEGISVTLILLLALVVLTKHGVVDRAQLTLQGSSLSGISLGVVACIFSLVGFEAPTAFGEEAKHPLKSIPLAVLWSLILTGLFFVFISYTQVAGLSTHNPPLDKIDAPLNVLSDLVHLSFLKVPISLGAMTSFFALALSCLSSGARILYPMGRHGVFHSSLGRAHTTNLTPHVAITLVAALMFAVPTVMSLFGRAASDAFGDVGTLGAFGFLFAYFLISIAAPVYLYRKGWLRPGHIFLSAMAVLFLLVPAVGSVYPVPAYPANIFPYLFLIYFAIGAAWFLWLFNRSPQVMEEIKQDFETTAGDLAPTL